MDISKTPERSDAHSEGARPGSLRESSASRALALLLAGGVGSSAMSCLNPHDLPSAAIEGSMPAENAMEHNDAAEPLFTLVASVYETNAVHCMFNPALPEGLRVGYRILDRNGYLSELQMATAENGFLVLPTDANTKEFLLILPGQVPATKVPAHQTPEPFDDKRALSQR